MKKLTAFQKLKLLRFVHKVAANKNVYLKVSDFISKL